MLVPDRRRRLLDELRRRGSAHVDELAAALGVSTSTVRRDLVLLAADGLLLRAHGGAYVDQDLPAAVRVAGDASADAAKQRIGQVAADGVADGMTIMILGGSTTGAMVPFLAGRSITVVTNGLDIGHALAAHAGVELVVLGGVLHREQMTMLGPMTEQNMADLHVDVMFAGAYGVAPQVGVTGAKLAPAGYHRSMLRHTDSLVVLADTTKLGRRGPTLLASIEQVDTFLTDARAENPVVTGLRALGARVTLC